MRLGLGPIHGLRTVKGIGNGQTIPGNGGNQVAHEIHVLARAEFLGQGEFPFFKRDAVGSFVAFGRTKVGVRILLRPRADCASVYTPGPRVPRERYSVTAALPAGRLARCLTGDIAHLGGGVLPPLLYTCAGNGDAPPASLLCVDAVLDGFLDEKPLSRYCVPPGQESKPPPPLRDF